MAFRLNELFERPHMLVGLVLATATFTLFGVGCDSATQCTDEARPSIQVHVEDESGNDVENATVEYRTNGNEQFEDCEQLSTDPEGVYEFTCAFEVAGSIEVRVSTPGGKDGAANVTVSDGECHVRTESITIVVN